jgi:hypothetical protein
MFRADEPILPWVEDALDATQDPSLHAGVKSYRHYIRLTQTTQDMIVKLMSQAGTHMAHAQEALIDLEQANAFERIHTEIRWRDTDNDCHMADVHAATNSLREITHAPSRRRYQAAPTPTHARRTALSASALKRHRKLRCHKCGQQGHIRKNCPDRA